MKSGVLLLSVWSGINLVRAIGIVASMLTLGRHAPALTPSSATAARPRSYRRGLQALGFASDARLDHRDLAVNLGSTAVLAAGLTLSWLAGRGPRRSEAQK